MKKKRILEEEPKPFPGEDFKSFHNRKTVWRAYKREYEKKKKLEGLD